MGLDQHSTVLKTMIYDIIVKNTHFPEFINIHQHASHPDGRRSISQELTYVAKVFIKAWLKGDKDC